MNKMAYKQRTYLDPIHGPIQLNLRNPLENLLIKIIDTKEFQRLRRIRQMGTGWFTFHGAEHTRFGHSLGTLFVAMKMVSELIKNNFNITKHVPGILVSSLLHDIGHGPLSHTSEKLVPVMHEEWTKKIITDSSEINSLLKSFNKTLLTDVVNIFEYKNVPLYVSQIVSSYIDCDRLDYLHRDSYYVGVPYGLTGANRIISSLAVDSKTGKLVIQESIGLDAVIHYLHARYSMYQQVYQHKKNLACDFILRKIVKRAKEIEPNNIMESIHSWFNIEKISDIDLDTYLQVDDYTFISSIRTFVSSSEDRMLSDLSARFLNRNVFKALEFRQDVNKEKIKSVKEDIAKIAKAKGYDPDFYLGIEQSASKPYEPYETKQERPSKSIYVKQKNGQVKELSMLSGLVKALSKENIVKTCLVFTPELEDEIKNKKTLKNLFK